MNLVYSQRNRSAVGAHPAVLEEPEGEAHRVPLSRPVVQPVPRVLGDADGRPRRHPEPHRAADAARPRPLRPPARGAGARCRRCRARSTRVLDALEADHEFLLAGGVFTPDVIETWIEYKRDQRDRRPSGCARTRGSSTSTTTSRRLAFDVCDGHVVASVAHFPSCALELHVRVFPPHARLATIAAMIEVIGGIEIPDTRLVADATALVRDAQEDFLYHHSRRVFLFAAIRGARLGLEPDPELLYVAAMFHDLGLMPPHASDTRRFEVDSALVARAFLRDHDVPEDQITRVVLAIALHTTPDIPELLEPEVALVHAGVETDVLGVGYSRTRHPAHHRDHERPPPPTLQVTDARSAHSRQPPPTADDPRYRERRRARALLPQLRANQLRRHRPGLGVARVTRLGGRRPR